MESPIQHILDEVVSRTLHSQSFARSSTQACHVLSDLLARYLVLLTSTCGRYAEHAGRNSISARDVEATLEEMGTDVQELKDFLHLEGRDLARYNYHTHRRRMDLNEVKGAWHSQCISCYSDPCLSALERRPEARSVRCSETLV